MIAKTEAARRARVIVVKHVRDVTPGIGVVGELTAQERGLQSMIASAIETAFADGHRELRAMPRAEAARRARAIVEEHVNVAFEQTLDRMMPSDKKLQRWITNALQKSWTEGALSVGRSS